MPRGKNYVNNNRGVVLQASKKNKQSMKQCEYGSACNRPDCIYRHDTAVAKTDEICLQFLAGTCAFIAGGCRKRHPNKEEKDRLLRKYKRTRCHFGDECRTDSCLYMHPREMKPVEPAYIEPVNMDVAFPALGASSSSKKATTSATNNGPKTEPLPASPWNASMQPAMQQNMPMDQQDVPNVPVAPAWFPQDPSFAPFCPPANQQQPMAYYGDGYDGGYGYEQHNNNGYGYEQYGTYDMGAHQQGGGMPTAPPPPAQSFNAGAKEFVPGGFSS